MSEVISPGVIHRTGPSLGAVSDQLFLSGIRIVNVRGPIECPRWALPKPSAANRTSITSTAALSFPGLARRRRA